MLKYDNNHLFTGYLKQLLHDFNLPQYRIYTAKDAAYKAKYNKESPNIIACVPKTDTALPDDMYYVHYIKDNQVQDYINETWKVNPYFHYHFNKKELNQTRKLRIINNIYDSYTHEYFGNYLRFLRDYNHLDLMSMYNCFSNNLCSTVKFEVNRHSYKDASGATATEIQYFTTDDQHKVYMLPVKLFNKYTIALDCSDGLEICCGLYNQYQEDNEALKDLPKYTYKRISAASFNEPIIYDKLYNKCIDDITATPAPMFDPDNKITVGDVQKVFRNELAQREETLKMFIKIPASCKSSIVILEGDYSNCNSVTYLNAPGTNVTQDLQALCNNSVINFEHIDDIVENRIELAHPLQLLRMNTGISYPFADRLIGFMLDNTITNMDYVVDDIDRVQKVISLNNSDAKFISGAWSDNIKYYVYEYMNNKTNNIPVDTLIDSTGYIDKDVEKYYSAYDPEIKSKVSISNVDIYSNI